MLSIQIMELVRADTTVKSVLSTRAGYNNNPRLRPPNSPSKEVLFSINEAKAEAAYSQPTYNVTATPKVRLSRYTNDEDLDSEEYFISLTAYKLLEHHQFFGEFNYQREASFQTQQDDFDVFNINVPQTTYSLGTSWSHLLTDRFTLSASGNALEVSFGEDPRSTFIGYEQYGLGTSVIYATSDRTKLLANFYINEFKTPSVNSKTVSYSFKVGFETQLDETLRTSFQVGHNISHLQFRTAQTQLVSLAPPLLQTIFIKQRDRSSGLIADLVVEKELERLDLEAVWSRRFSASSFGSRRETQEVNGNARYRITKFTLAGLEVNYQERTQEGQVNARQSADISVIALRARLVHRITSSLQAELEFRFRQRERINPGIKSDSQAVFLALRFNPQIVP